MHNISHLDETPSMLNWKKSGFNFFLKSWRSMIACIYMFAHSNVNQSPFHYRKEHVANLWEDIVLATPADTCHDFWPKQDFTNRKERKKKEKKKSLMSVFEQKSSFFSCKPWESIKFFEYSRFLSQIPQQFLFLCLFLISVTVLIHLQISAEKIQTWFL